MSGPLSVRMLAPMCYLRGRRQQTGIRPIDFAERQEASIPHPGHGVKHGQSQAGDCEMRAAVTLIPNPSRSNLAPRACLLEAGLALMCRMHEATHRKVSS